MELRRLPAKGLPPNPKNRRPYHKEQSAAMIARAGWWRVLTGERDDLTIDAGANLPAYPPRYRSIISFSTKSASLPNGGRSIHALLKRLCKNTPLRCEKVWKPNSP